MFSPKLCFQLVGSQYVLLVPMEVVFLEADRQVCHIIMADNNRLVAVRHLGYYKKELLEHYKFLELSKSLLVNTIHIVKYSPRERTVQLSTGQSLPVAKSRQEHLNKLFRQLHDQWSNMDNPPNSMESDDAE